MSSIDNNQTIIQKTTVFPGLPARLEVAEQSNFPDAQDALFLKHVWKFFNKDGNPKSLINRVEVWKDRTDTICLIEIYFNMIGCEEMRKSFSHLNPLTIHHHEYDWCKMKFMHPRSMRAVLKALMESQQFVGDSKERVNCYMSNCRRG